MAEEKKLKYKLIISGFLIFVSLTATLAKDKEKELPLKVNGQQKFFVTVKNEDPPITPTSICKKKAHNFRIEIEKKSKKWITFLKKIKKDEKWITVKSNIIKVARGKSIIALFNADGEKMKEGINIGRIEFKCRDCKGPHKLPETVKVIGTLEEIQARKNWLVWVLWGKKGLTRTKKFRVNPNTDEVVIVKGDLPVGAHEGGGLFLPGRKGKKTDLITPLLKAYNKLAKKPDKEFVKRLEVIKKKFSGRNIIIVSTDASGYNPGSPLKLDDKEKAVILLAALHELKHFKHEQRGKRYNAPRDEMEVIAWQLLSREVKEFFRTYIYNGRRKLPKDYIPINEKRMLIEYYLDNWKIASKTDKKKVGKYYSLIKRMVNKFNRSLKGNEQKIKLPENFK